MRKPEDEIEIKKKYLQLYKEFSVTISAMEELLVLIQKDSENLKKLDKNLIANKQVETMTKEIENSIIKKYDTCREILKAIDKIEDETERTLLIFKYINGNTWESICEKMSYSLRQVYNIHNKALKNVHF